MVLVGQRPDRHHGTTLILVVHNLGPDKVTTIGVDSSLVQNRAVRQGTKRAFAAANSNDRFQRNVRFLSLPK